MCTSGCRGGLPQECPGGPEVLGIQQLSWLAHRRTPGSPVENPLHDESEGLSFGWKRRALIHEYENPGGSQ